MNEQEKSLALAKLMKWKPYLWNGIYVIDKGGIPTRGKYISGYSRENLCPYSPNKEGRAQFAAILLEFPEAMCEMIVPDGALYLKLRFKDTESTQSNFLDEVLRLNGVNPDE